MIDFTTLENAKDFLGLDYTNTDGDVIITRLITSVSSLIRNILSRDITTNSYTMTLNGGGLSYQMMPNYPIQSVESLSIDGIIKTAFTFDDIAVYLTDGSLFTRATQNVQISFTAGFVNVPYDIEQATIEIVSRKYKERDRIGISSKGMAGETTSYSQSSISADIRKMLENYNKVIPL